MKILLVHNHYRSGMPSGENLVFELERRLLESNGHEVATFERRSDELVGSATGTLRGALATPWNPGSARRFRDDVARFRPDVIHAHNTFPLISPAIFAAVGDPRRLGGAAPARVLTLHNYRLFCAAGVPMRDARVCTECLDRRSVLPAIRHGCYRHSRLATLPVALGVALHRGLDTWNRHVEAFIALTEFQRERMIAAGLLRERVHVKPHFYPGAPEVRPWASRDDAVVFVGRVGEEKGVADLVSAWLAWGEGAPELRLVGDGPLRNTLEGRVRDAGARNIRFTGQLPSDEAQRLIGAARLLVLPSVWFEGFPMVIREALALGTPCAVSRIGPLPDLVGQGTAGVTFSPGDDVALLDTVRELWSSPARLEAMSAAARREYEAHYTEAANYRRLLAIYDQALALRRARPSSTSAPAAPVQPAS